MRYHHEKTNLLLKRKHGFSHRNDVAYECIPCIDMPTYFYLDKKTDRKEVQPREIMRSTKKEEVLAY
jgi:hypothetical protein